MILDRAQGILIVPLWKSAPFWPLLCQNGCFINIIKEFIMLPTEAKYYTKCKNGHGIFGNIDLKFGMLALRVNC